MTPKRAFLASSSFESVCSGFCGGSHDANSPTRRKWILFFAEGKVRNSLPNSFDSGLTRTRGMARGHGLSLVCLWLHFRPSPNYQEIRRRTRRPDHVRQLREASPIAWLTYILHPHGSGLAYKNLRFSKKGDGVDHVSRFTLGPAIKGRQSSMSGSGDTCKGSVGAIVTSWSRCTAFRMDRWTHGSTVRPNLCRNAR